MDFNRIGKLIKQTKDKLIVATDTDLFVVMDLDSYEDLIKQNQTRAAFVAKDALKIKDEPVMSDIADEIPVESFEEKIKKSGPISVKDVIADKTEQTFTPPIADSLAVSRPFSQSSSDEVSVRGQAGQVDEEDEFYFEEVD